MFTLTITEEGSGRADGVAIERFRQTLDDLDVPTIVKTINTPVRKRREKKEPAATPVHRPKIEPVVFDALAPGPIPSTTKAEPAPKKPKPAAAKVVEPTPQTQPANKEVELMSFIAENEQLERADKLMKPTATLLSKLDLTESEAVEIALAHDGNTFGDLVLVAAENKWVEGGEHAPKAISEISKVMLASFLDDWHSVRKLIAEKKAAL